MVGDLPARTGLVHVNFADVRGQLKEFTRGLLSRYVTDQHVRGYCLHFLAQEGAILNEGPVVGIGHGAFLVFNATGGTDTRQFIPPTAGLELLNLGIELLDKVTDEEPPVGEGIWTVPRMAIVASVLQSLSTLAVADMPGVTRRVQAAYQRLLSRTNVTILSGGNKDILLADKKNATVNDSLKLAVYKSQALGDCMGRIGAMAAGAPAPVVEACARFGAYALVSAALVNDMHDARPGSENKSDIRLRRKTAPVTYLLTRTPRTRFTEAKRLLRGEAPLTAEQESVVRRAIEESGAVQFTATLADAFRYKARDALERVNEAVDVSLLSRGLLQWQD